MGGSSTAAASLMFSELAFSFASDYKSSDAHTATIGAVVYMAPSAQLKELSLAAAATGASLSWTKALERDVEVAQLRPMQRGDRDWSKSDPRAIQERSKSDPRAIASVR
jgi:hypothetical protein